MSAATRVTDALRRRWRRTAGVAALAMVAAAAPLLPIARSAVVGAPNGDFESTDLSSWSRTSLRRVTDLPFAGAAALAVAAVPGAVPALTAPATTSQAGRQQLTMAVRATAATVGRQVTARLTDAVSGRPTTSAPVTLQPWWQTVTVTLANAAPRLTLGIAATSGTWNAGDAFVVDAVRVASVAPTRASTQGRLLLVNGAQYVMRGTVYLPAPIGGTPWTNDWTTDPVQCQNDAQLMRVAGFNTLRAGLDPNNWRSGPATQCMDAFAGAGIHIIWGVNPPGGLQYQVDSPLFVEAFWTTLQRAIMLTKDHPVTLGYSIGNEVNYLKPNAGGWWPQLDELARRAKGLDPTHVFTSTISTNQYVQPYYGGVKPGFVPHIDMWGLNLFARHGTYAAYMQDARTRDPTRPVWFSEFGVDRYRCLDPRNTLACGPGSHEDPPMQASWDANNWREIAAHLTPVDPTGGLVGGTVFMWSDAWWFAAGFAGVGTPAERDTSGIDNGFTHDHFPDGHQSSDFYGVNHATMPNTTGPRVTTSTYDALATLYTGRPGFAVSPPRVQVKGCSAVVNFASSVPVFGRVDFGPVVINRLNNGIVADSFYPTSWSQAAAATTGHLFTLTGLTAGTTYEIHARGVDGGGRVGSPDGVRVTTPATC